MRAALEQWRRIAVFGVLLAIVASGPVLAADSDSPPDNVNPPDAAQVAEALALAEANAEERERELRSPASRQAREASRSAYADLSVADARDLLSESFADVLLALDSEPGRYLSDVKLEKSFDETSARIVSGDGKSLLESAIPVRAESEDGALKKVDLDLVETADGFEPENPLVDVVIPHNLSEAIAIGDEGLAVAPAGADQQGSAFDEENVFYSEVREDADILVAPIAGGVEIFDQLRSIESPEELPYDLRLPDGAEIRRNGGGGADVVRGEEMLASVAPPSAVDAQGTPVPTSLRLDGDHLIVSVPHVDKDFAYPILVDPAITEGSPGSWYWNDLTSLGGWAPSGDESQTYYLRSSYCIGPKYYLCSPSGRGLFVEALDGWIPANTYSQWYYTVPGTTTFIPSIYPEASATIDPFWRTNNGCSWEANPQPHDYAGAFNASGIYTTLWTDQAQWYGKAQIFDNAKGIAFGMSTGGSGVNLPCDREIMVGGVSVRLDDPENPTLSTPTGFPSSWVKSGQAFTVTANVSDPGLGVQNVRVYPKGRPDIPYVSPGSVCPGTKTSPCPAAVSASFPLNESHFDEGEKVVEVSGTDPTGKTSSTFTHVMKVDRTKPAISLLGPLANATEETGTEEEDPKKWDELGRPLYRLDLRVTDGSNASPEQKRSGVKSVKLFLDGSEAPVEEWTVPSCTSSCKVEESHDLRLAELGVGKHTLEIVAADWAGNEPRSRTIEFEYFPATGDKDEYVMERFPLDDGTDPEAPGAKPWPEISVNVANGNLLFEQRDIDIEGAAVDLEVERVYNSLLPEELDSEWGDGWTLAQTPALEVVDTGGSPAPDQADVVDASGTIENQVELPIEVSKTSFDPGLQVAITKEADGGFALEAEGADGNGSLVFDENGRAEAFVSDGSEETAAEIAFDYEAGELSEIAVDDPLGNAETPEEPPTMGSEGRDVPSFRRAMPRAMSDVVRDSKGNLWGIHTGANRVVGIRDNGESILTWGTKGPGENFWTFNRPTAIAFSGNLIIADSGNGQIQLYDTTGKPKGYFGSFGSGNSQFAEPGPEGVAFEPFNSTIWVADTHAGKIKVFTEQGEFVETFGSPGSGEGEFDEPKGIAFSPLTYEGWIVDSGNDRIVVVEPFSNGAYLSSIGGPGDGPGEFDNPTDITFDSYGNAWVTDKGNSRVQGFAPGGEYIGEFGQPGSGAGQFQAGLGGVIAEGGKFWVADPGNNRTQVWLNNEFVPTYSPRYSALFGGAGSTNGKFNQPADIDSAKAGNLWVVDKKNNRLQQFNATGTFVSKVGTAGSGAGQFAEPSALAIDPDDRLWIADTQNDRIQRLSSAGVHELSIGKAGAGNGEFDSPQGIAIARNGDVWVADTKNSRLQVFDKTGTFLRAVGAPGAEPGEFNEPTGLAVNASGDVFVADTGNHRIQVFNEDGEQTGSFGSKGKAAAQLESPTGIEVDDKGVVWVADTGNDALKAFDEGIFVRKIAYPGTEEGFVRFAGPVGIEAGSEGRLWATDTENNRVQQWVTPAAELDESLANEILENNDPAVAVETDSDLVSEVSGGGAGTHSYEHDGADLVAHEGPDGRATYEYDGDGLLTEVELPNGTKATMTYEAVSGRVKTVTVDPAGEGPDKTTYFSYNDDALTTTVERPDASTAAYYFYEDGSVFKIWNTAEPPEVVLSGSLWAGKEGPAISGGLHNLEIQAHSNDGIAAIEVMDGNVIVSEKTCQQDPEVEGIECVDVPDEWAAETEHLSPGIHMIEVLVTDRLGQTVSRRFWVDIPYTAPLVEGEEERPRFSEVKEFRVKFGLDLDLNPITQELMLNDRIYDLLGAWGNPQTPLGEVARYGTANWGAPMRPQDVAEMEYREWYVRENALRIDNWGETNYPGSYAGYSVDHPAGGIIRVGFTENASSRVAAMKEQLGLVAQDRITSYTASEGRSLQNLEDLREEISQASMSDPGLGAVFSSAGIDEEANEVVVGASNKSSAETSLNNIFGASAPIRVESEISRATEDYAPKGAIWAGENILTGWLEDNDEDCTAGYGGVKSIPKANGGTKQRYWLLTAAHCYISPKPEKYFHPRGTDYAYPIGEKQQDGFPGGGHWETDVMAIRLKDGYKAGKWIYRPQRTKTVTEAGWANNGNVLCFSGVATGAVKCGASLGFDERDLPDGVPGPEHGISGVINIDVKAWYGDSGAPVWNKTTHKVVGILTGIVGREGFDGDIDEVKMSYMTPLITPKNVIHARVPGVFGAAWFGSADLVESP